MDYIARHSVPATADEQRIIARLLKTELSNAAFGSQLECLSATPQPATSLPDHPTPPWVTWNVLGEQCMMISMQERVFVIAQGSPDVCRLEPRPFTFRTRMKSRYRKESSADPVYTHPTVVLLGTLAWRRGSGAATAKTQQQHADARAYTMGFVDGAGPDLAHGVRFSDSLTFVISDCLWNRTSFGAADLHVRLTTARALVENTSLTAECPLHYESVDGAQLQFVYRACQKPLYARSITTDVPPALYGVPIDGVQVIYPELPRRSARFVFRRRAWNCMQTLARRADEDSVVLLDHANRELAHAELHETVQRHELLAGGAAACLVDVRAQDDGRLEVIRVRQAHGSVVAATGEDLARLQWDEPLATITQDIYRRTQRPAPVQ